MKQTGFRCFWKCRALLRLMAELPDRTQDILQRLASGQSHAEIVSALGVSKQAIHKTAAAALEKLRTQLASLGFARLDSEELLKSATG
ncbi:MAG: RNA polymerase sigma factor [Roseimicrobium sp.]